MHIFMTNCLLMQDEIIFFRDAQFSSIAFTQPSIFVHSRMIAPTCFTDESHILQHMIEGRATSGYTFINQISGM